jgi:hypothetical protein
VDGRLPRLGEHRVVEARHEQGCSHDGVLLRVAVVVAVGRFGFSSQHPTETSSSPT